MEIKSEIEEKLKVLGFIKVDSVSSIDCFQDSRENFQLNINYGLRKWNLFRWVKIGNSTGADILIKSLLFYDKDDIIETLKRQPDFICFHNQSLP